MKGILASFLEGDSRGSREVLVLQNIRHHLRQYRYLYLFCVLSLMIGFEAAITLGFIDSRLGAIFSACLCTLLCLFCIYLFLPRTCVRSLSDLDVANLLERDIVPLEAGEAHIVLKGQVVLVTGAAGSIGSEI